MPNRNSMQSLLLAKPETVDGTDASPAVATDGIMILEPIEAAGDMAFKTPREKLAVGAAIQSSPPLKPTGSKGAWSSNVHVRGARNGLLFSASNLPELHPFWISAGYAATVTTTGGAETVLYKPAPTNLLGHTEYYYVDGRLYKLLGTRADIDLSFDAGGPLVAAIKRQGLYSYSDATLPTVVSGTYGASQPPIAENVALAINFGSSFTAGIIRKFSLSSGTKIAQRPNANVTGALMPDRVRSRGSKFTITLEDELGSVQDFEGFRVNNTPGTLSFLVGGTQYSKFGLTLPNVRVEDVKRSTDNGTELVTISGGVYDSTFAANDSVQALYQ
jgi:hypothetical protein